MGCCDPPLDCSTCPLKLSPPRYLPACLVTSFRGIRKKNDNFFTQKWLNSFSPSLLQALFTKVWLVLSSSAARRKRGQPSVQISVLPNKVLLSNRKRGKNSKFDFLFSYWATTLSGVELTPLNFDSVRSRLLFNFGTPGGGGWVPAHSRDPPQGGVPKWPICPAQPENF